MIIYLGIRYNKKYVRKYWHTDSKLEIVIEGEKQISIPLSSRKLLFIFDKFDKSFYLDKITNIDEIIKM